MDKPGSDYEELYDSDREDGNSKHSALSRQGNYKRSKKARHGTPRSINCGESVYICIKVEEIPTIKAATSSQRMSLPWISTITQIQPC